MKVEPCCDNKGLIAEGVVEEGVYEFLQTPLPTYLLVIGSGKLLSRLVYSTRASSIQVLEGLSTYKVVKTNKKLCVELKD